MGNRKAPTPVPTNQRKPDPPPPPPAKKTTVQLDVNVKTKVRVSGSCDLFATFPMQCPLCDEIVPAKTSHHCIRPEEQ